MPRIRALHQVAVAGDDQLAKLMEVVTQVRAQPGCHQAEAYVSADGTSVVIVELWSDTVSHGRYWCTADSGNPVLRALSQEQTTSEFYRHQDFVPGTKWTPASDDPSVTKIEWPAAGPVRIIVSGSSDNVGAMVEAVAADTDRTRREAGCMQFDWFHGIEFPTQFMLLELWRDQAIYDAHWQLRVASGAGGANGGGTAPPPARHRDPGDFEFYRHETFRRVDGRWAPTDILRRSQTVIWPA